MNSARFDLVLVDNYLPDINSVELAHKIKALNPKTSIVLLSTINNGEVEPSSSPFSAILTKPLKKRLLHNCVQQVLQTSTAHKAEQKIVQQLSTDFASQHPLKILVAEDNPVNQKLIVHVLNRLGYQPKLVENGQQAVAEAKQNGYDLILMDIQMPEMDGLEATQLIRKSLQQQPVIVALTANTMQGDQETCINAGMDDYLGKPVKFEQLMEKLVKWSVVPA